MVANLAFNHIWSTLSHEKKKKYKMKKNYKVTFQVPLWCSRLPRLHKHCQSNHISNHNSKRQADHEGHSEGAVEHPTAAEGAEGWK